MKLISMIAAATLAISPIAANAGGLAAVVQEPIIMDKAPAEGSVSAAVLIPVLLLAFLALSASADSDDDTPAS